MNNNILSALDEQFYIECEVVKMKYEYPNYTGAEKWMVFLSPHRKPAGRGIEKSPLLTPSKLILQ